MIISQYVLSPSCSLVSGGVSPAWTIPPRRPEIHLCAGHHRRAPARDRHGGGQKRPGYAPTALSAPGQSSGGIIGYVHEVTDDGKYSITEYVARDISAFKAILNDKQIKSFIKGQDKKSTIEAGLKKYRKDFDLDKFGLVMP